MMAQNCNDTHISTRKSQRILNSKNVAIPSVSDNSILSMEVDKSPIDEDDSSMEVDESPIDEDDSSMEVDDSLSEENDFCGSPKKKKPRHEITKKKNTKRLQM